MAAFQWTSVCLGEVVMRFLTLVILMLSLGSPSTAQEYQVGSYRAWIGVEDLFNSRGQRLSDAAAILRQDRANFHKFGIRHAGDESELWFHIPAERAAMAAMFQAGGGIPGYVQELVVQGNVPVYVTLYAVDGNFTRLTVDVPG